ncbi:hypothetical protein QQ008_15475 [Fulvivirgaceae bacterium BMA10]|uniref:Uncharacterized protein n=1 Tax=Splendidivirga corallicola TaxID=3051826 RepID=A0ABT8KPX2_9BACT|nr:hypothetical protein [Fulvivirgaceae bacterium BMA10]
MTLTIVVCVNTYNTPSNACTVFEKVFQVVLNWEVPNFKTAEKTGEDLTKYVDPEKMYNLGNGEFWIEQRPLHSVIFDINDAREVRALIAYYTGYYDRLERKEVKIVALVRKGYLKL